MKKSLLFALAFAASLAVSAAPAAKSYQVTGKVLEVTDTKIVVENKDGEKWEIARTADTKGATAKAGDKVTIKYTMSAVSVETKGEEAPAKK